MIIRYQVLLCIKKLRRTRARRIRVLRPSQVTR
jgi:hypothetical protein